MTTAKQRFGKHIPEVTQSTMEGPPLLGSKSLGTFHINGKIRNNRVIQELLEAVVSFRFAPSYKRQFIRVEAGSNTSTVTLRVVGGDEKGSLKSETVKYGRKSQETRTTALARASGTYKRQTRPLVRDGAPRKQERNCQTEINIWSWAPDGAQHQDLLTD
jgi:hypothetical protein